MLEREQRYEMGGGRFKIGDEPLDASAEKSVEDHGGNADPEAAAGVDEGFADAFGEEDVARRSKLGAKSAERANDADDGTEQSNQRSDRRNIGEVSHSVVQVGRT